LSRAGEIVFNRQVTRFSIWRLTVAPSAPFQPLEEFRDLGFHAPATYFSAANDVQDRLRSAGCGRFHAEVVPRRVRACTFKPRSSRILTTVGLPPGFRVRVAAIKTSAACSSVQPSERTVIEQMFHDPLKFSIGRFLLVGCY